MGVSYKNSKDWLIYVATNNHHEYSRKIKTTAKIKPDFWYIVRYKNLLKCKLIRFEFEYPKAAQYFLDYFRLRTGYEIIKGKKAIGYGLNLDKTVCATAGWDFVNSFKLEKYEYPIERETYQHKKTFRTSTRRKLRKYKAYVANKNKKKNR